MVEFTYEGEYDQAKIQNQMDHQGDRNTKFFHARLQSKRRGNQILVLNKECPLLEYATDIKMEVRRFYEDS